MKSNEDLKGERVKSFKFYVPSSCLENPRDGGAWWAAVYGFAQSDATDVTLQQQQ